MRAWMVNVAVAVSLGVVLLLPLAAAVAQVRRPFPVPLPTTPPPPSPLPSPTPSPLPNPIPPGIVLQRRLPPPLPNTDFVWTWGEQSEDGEAIDSELEEGLVVVRVEGRQGGHACELTAELIDYFDPESERVKGMRRTLEGLADARDFANRVRSTMESQTLIGEIQRRDSVIRAARLSCVVSPSEDEQRARERARRAQERRRSQ